MPALIDVCAHAHVKPTLDDAVHWITVYSDSPTIKNLRTFFSRIDVELDLLGFSESYDPNGSENTAATMSFPYAQPTLHQVSQALDVIFEHATPNYEFTMRYFSPANGFIEIIDTKTWWPNEEQECP